MDITSTLITVLVLLGMLLFGLLAVLPTWFEASTRRRAPRPAPGSAATRVRARLG